ncbi:MAG: glucosamine-6-phosphate deaminase [Planctomycetota bacterium]|nr:glucosamine-6-phosphate deaminase [Planctomycetota bacterium]MCX8040222.1 glucosamine-6-phosphate deaminase [Planctomycetota bacterium]MDW8372483.1 glucosamine-6-phosphate deaminase [Planctomycetota bacterium]
MRLIVCNDREDAASRLADLLAEALIAQPAINLGLSAGTTSVLAYIQLVRRFHAGGFSFRQATTFNTDEYIGLKPTDHRSTRYVMNANLFYLVDIPREQTFVPRGDVSDLEAECKAFDLLIAARGGLDLVVLGLGHNGHVGLNEPGSSPRSRTRVVQLTASTLAAVSSGERFRSVDEVPPQAISMGMAQILEARRVLLIATGLGKAEAVSRMLTARASPGVPASLLTGHPDCVLIADHAALGQTPKELVASLSA